MKYIILLALLIPGIATASFDTSLKYGSKGASVVELQEFLIDQGCLNSVATGNFYALTLRAVKCFQQAHALPVTGYFGPMSRTVASEMIAVETASSTAEEITETGTTTPVIAPIVPPVATTTIIQYITYQMPPQVSQPVVQAPMTVGAVSAPNAPAPVVYQRLHTGSNDIYHFTKDTEWTYFASKYYFGGERISLVSLGVYPDEPDSKMLAGLPTFEKGDFTFSSAVPFPAGKYVVRAVISGSVWDSLGQKVSMWTNDTDVETIENK